MMTDLRSYFYTIITNQHTTLFARMTAGVLTLLSWVYGAGVRLRAFLYDAGILRSYRVNCMVISVGNITFGGSGKTPLCVMLVNGLAARGKSGVIISRGYGKRSHGEAADEVAMLERLLPQTAVYQGKDRLKSITAALKETPYDYCLLDDGFQHMRLKRDIDIVLIDATDPFGIGRLIPRGSLREPLSALKRAGIIIITKANLAQASFEPLVRQRLMRYAPEAHVYTADLMLRSIYPLGDPSAPQGCDTLAGKKVALLSGLGNPEAFATTVRQCGAKIVIDKRFMDHTCFTTDDITTLMQQMEAMDITTLVTTEKDAIRLERVAEAITAKSDIMVLQVMMQLRENDEKKFFDRLYTGNVD